MTSVVRCWKKHNAWKKKVTRYWNWTSATQPRSVLTRQMKSSLTWYATCLPLKGIAIPKVFTPRVKPSCSTTRLVACVMLPWKIFTSAMVYRSLSFRQCKHCWTAGTKCWFLHQITHYGPRRFRFPAVKRCIIFAMNPLTGSRTSMIFALKLRLVRVGSLLSTQITQPARYIPKSF